MEIYDNEVYNGGDEAVGIFLHRSSNGNKVYGENLSTVTANLMLGLKQPCARDDLVEPHSGYWGTIPTV